MKSVREVEKKYGSRALTAAIIAAFIFVLLGLKPVSKGLILGTLFSILNFVVMGETLPRRIAPNAKKGFLLSLGSIAVRYVLMAVPLVMALKSDAYNLIAVVCGIFMVQLMILTDHFSTLIFSNEAGKKALWKS